MSDHSRADALSAMAAHGETVSDRATEAAIDRLEAKGGVNKADRDAVEALADRLVDSLLYGPMAEIASGDDEAVAAALALFSESGESPSTPAAERAAAGE